MYEREQVPEYWFVDLDAERVEVYRLTPDGYASPALFEGEQTLTSTAPPGLSIPVTSLLPD